MEVEARCGEARVGRVHTPRGSFETPCFMPVGTRGAVRTLSAADLEELGASVVLGNTYHLMLKPGADVVAALGGLHGFMDWEGHVLTDSGGFQVFSLDPKVDDDGVTFKSAYDGGTHRLTPEAAVDVQIDLGGDIQMVLDVCTALPADRSALALAVERTAAWATRARAAHDARRERDGRAASQALFGIVQGGVDVDLRRDSTERTLAIGFDGYAVGGLSVGESRDEMLPALEACTALLPDDRPRYFMGIGDPVGIVECVARGVDMFDCVQPTRFGRHGTVLTSAGRINLKNATFATDDGPLDPACDCVVCQRWSRGYLRHLLTVHEPTAPRLLTLHNVAWTFALVARVRAAVRAGTLDVLRAEIAEVWG
jgi:queuine tRNA-ribosyltransferase